jgi:HK97 family phage prohead protease
MKTKRHVRVELKEISQEGTFEGLLSPYGGLPDSYGDVVERGAYTKTLKEMGNTRPLLWQHGTKDPIGLVTLEDRDDGLWCKGSLVMEDDLAKRAYRFIKAGIVKGLSIGYESLNDTIKSGIRHLTEIKLYEGSIVTFPANETALITSVKSALERKGDFNQELTEIQLSDGFYQMGGALRSALSSVFWAELSNEEKVAAAGEIIDQFRESYMTYLPQYLDLLAELYGDEFKARQIEHKAGRAISAANKSTISTAHEHLKSAADILSALLSGEAEDTATGESTSDEKSREAEPAAGPVEDDHSEISQLLQTAQEKGIYRWNLKTN